MIKVDRYRKEKGQLIIPSEKWFEDARKETATAIAEGAQHQITQLYKDNQVKMALEKLFHKKCAYCESPLSNDEWDVEHFRPKGKVAERPDHPGYYWLAYTWENLYPACTFCNQLRKDYPLYDDPRVLPAQGKLDKFPLVDERCRAKKPDENLSMERPLLLDPCVDEPENYFTYTILGEISPIDTTNARATETIRICHLKRRRLRDARVVIIKRVSKILKIIMNLQHEENVEIENQLRQLLEELTDSSSVYAGAARAVVSDPEAFFTE